MKTWLALLIALWAALPLSAEAQKRYPSCPLPPVRPQCK
jgi:hypothetical protein